MPRRGRARDRAATRANTRGGPRAGSRVSPRASTRASTLASRAADPSHHASPDPTPAVVTQHQPAINVAELQASWLVLEALSRPPAVPPAPGEWAGRELHKKWLEARRVVANIKYGDGQH
jgi:hypothetical protein